MTESETPFLDLPPELVVLILEMCLQRHHFHDIAALLSTCTSLSVNPLVEWNAVARERSLREAAERLHEALATLEFAGLRVSPPPTPECTTLLFGSLAERKASGFGLGGAVVQTIRACTALTELDLSGLALDAGEFGLLAEHLTSSTSLRVADLRLTGMDAGGATSFAAGVAASTSLEKLDLSSNAIGDAGAAAIACALQSNTSLTYLNLGVNAIGRKGVAALDRAARARLDAGVAPRLRRLSVACTRSSSRQGPQGRHPAHREAAPAGDAWGRHVDLAL